MSDKDTKQDVNVKIDKKDETTKDLDLPQDQSKGVKGGITQHK